MFEAEGLAHAIVYCQELLKQDGQLIHTEKWQGVDIKQKPEMAMYEVSHISFSSPVSINGTPNIIALQQNVQPNLPWAEDHFLERVAGDPLNPGNEWRNWPWSNSADKFRMYDNQFSHTYMERYWPTYAGYLPGGYADYDELEEQEAEVRKGVRFDYGDLNDVISLIKREPLTRQAYLPVWFPEDTGVKFGGRVPCTIGYHFLMRNGEMDITYWIRSCDFMRHFKDDIYLTVRLLYWVLEQLAAKDRRWLAVKPGKLIMHIGSLHLFRNDYIQLFGGESENK